MNFTILKSLVIVSEFVHHFFYFFLIESAVGLMLLPLPLMMNPLPMLALPSQIPYLLARFFVHLYQGLHVHFKLGGFLGEYFIEIAIGENFKPHVNCIEDSLTHLVIIWVFYILLLLIFLKKVKVIINDYLKLLLFLAQISNKLFEYLLFKLLDLQQFGIEFLAVTWN